MIDIGVDSFELTRYWNECIPAHLALKRMLRRVAQRSMDGAVFRNDPRYRLQFLKPFAPASISLSPPAYS